MRATTVLTFLLASAGIGCDSATEPATVDDLVGRWNASKYLVRNAASTAQSVDFLNISGSMEPFPVESVYYAI